MRSGADWLTEEDNATDRAQAYEPVVAQELALLNAHLSAIGHLLYELLAYVQRIDLARSTPDGR